MAEWGAAYWKATAERVISTGLEIAIATVGVYTVVSEVDWANVANVSGLAMILSLMKATLANATLGNGPGLVKSEKVEVVKNEQQPESQG